MAPGYLDELCRPVSSIDGHRHLYELLAVASLTFHELDRQVSTYGGRVFCHAEPSV